MAGPSLTPSHMATVRTLIGQKRRLPDYDYKPEGKRRQSRPSKRYRKALNLEDNDYVDSEPDEDDVSRNISARFAAHQQSSDPTISRSVHTQVEARLHGRTGVPMLAGIAMRAAVQQLPSYAFIQASKTDVAWKDTASVRKLKSQLMQLPPHLATKLLNALFQVDDPKLFRAVSHITILLLSCQPHAFVIPPAAPFSLGAKGRPLLSKLSTDCGESLTVLDLSTQKSLDDQHVATLLQAFTQLKKLILRGCTALGDNAIHAVAKASSSTLTTVNLAFTGITAKSLTILFKMCRHLEVIKLTGLTMLTDNKVSTIVGVVLQEATSGSGPHELPLSKVKSLKLKGTRVTEVGIARLLTNMPLLESLDIAFTHTRSLDVLLPLLFPAKNGIISSNIHKLVLSGLALKRNSLSRFFKTLAKAPAASHLPLRCLKMSSMGSTNFRAGLDPDHIDGSNLKDMQQGLAKCEALQTLSLYGNERIWANVTNMRFFFATVGRRCVHLDLSHTVAGTGSLPVYAFQGLTHDIHGEPFVESPSLQTLTLSNTRIDDEHASILAGCSSLRKLYIENSRLSAKGLQIILDSLPDLWTIDLTGCRGIKLAKRRDVFSFWLDDELETDED